MDDRDPPNAGGGGVYFQPRTANAKLLLDPHAVRMAVSKVSCTRPSKNPDSQTCWHRAGSDNEASSSCEVDVIAQGGHAWIEVKSHRPFGTASQHFVGSSGHQKGENSHPHCTLAC